MNIQLNRLCLFFSLMRRNASEQQQKSNKFFVFAPNHLIIPSTYGSELGFFVASVLIFCVCKIIRYTAYILHRIITKSFVAHHKYVCIIDLYQRDKVCAKLCFMLIGCDETTQTYQLMPETIISFYFHFFLAYFHQHFWRLSNENSLFYITK